MIRREHKKREKMLHKNYFFIIMTMQSPQMWEWVENNLWNQFSDVFPISSLLALKVIPDDAHNDKNSQIVQLLLYPASPFKQLLHFVLKFMEGLSHHEQGKQDVVYFTDTSI